METPRFDPMLKTYIQIIQTSENFKSKLIYALHCIHNTIQPTNPNLLPNKNYLIPRLSQIIKISDHYCEPSLLQILMGILNRIGDQKTFPFALKLLKIMRHKRMQGEITDAFIQQFQLMARVIAYCEQYINDIVQTVIKFLTDENLTQSQIDSLLLLILDEIDNNNASIPLNICLKMIESSKLKISDVLRILQRTIARSDMKSMDRGQIMNFLENISNKHWLNEETKYLCSLILLQIGKGKEDKKYNLFQGKQIKQAYCPQSQTVQRALSSRNSIVSEFEYIIDYLHKEKAHNIRWKQNVQIQGNNEQVAKLSTIRRILTNSNQLVNEQYVYKQVPIEYLRNSKVIIKRLKEFRNTYDVIQTLKHVDQHQINENIYPQLLLQLLKICLANKETKLVCQCEYFIRKTFNQSFVVSQLHKYSVFVPVCCSYQLLESAKFANFLLQMLKNIYLTLQEKFYIFKWVLMGHHDNVLIVKNFFNYILRILDTQPKVYQQLLYLLKSEVQAHKKEWLVNQLREEVQKILQKVLVNINKKNPDNCIKLVFQFSKLGMFKEWQTIYRWGLSPLQHNDPNNVDLTTDYLQVFQALVQQCPTIPAQIKKKFVQFVCQNWTTYNNEHMFAIERIINCMSKEEEYEGHQESIKEWGLKLFKKEYNGKVLGSQFLFIEEEQVEDEQIVHKQLFEDLKQILKQKYSQFRIPYTQYLILWRFQYTDITMPKYLSEVCFKQLCDYKNINSFKVIKNYYEIISTIAHQQNILQIPLSQILREMGHSSKILQNSTDIIENILQVNAKSVHKYKLQGVMHILLSKLTIAYEDNIQLINILDKLCMQGCAYHNVLKQNMHLIEQVLRTQYTIHNMGYRPETISFCLQLLQSNINGKHLYSLPKYMTHIIYKYLSEEQIVKRCLKYYKKTDTFINKHIIDRVKQEHSESQQIEQLCRCILDKNSKSKDNKNQLPVFSQQVLNKYRLAQMEKDRNKQIAREKEKESQRQKLKQKEQQMAIIKQRQKEVKQQKQLIKIQSKMPQSNIHMDVPSEQEEEDIIHTKDKHKLQQSPNKSSISQISHLQDLSPTKSQSPKILKLAPLEMEEINKTPEQLLKELQDLRKEHRKKQKKYLQQLKEGYNKAQDKPTLTKFYKPPPTKQEDYIIIDRSRVQRMEDGQEMQGEQVNLSMSPASFDLTTMKKHMQLIQTLNHALSQEQEQKFLNSIKYLTQTVKTHQYYCKKAVGMGIFPKTLQVNKINEDKYTINLLVLFKEISIRKEKNLLIFNDQKLIQFLKRVLKKSVITNKDSNDNVQILEIVQNCKNCMKFFYKYGLLSMLVELAKNQINHREIIKMFINNEMHINIINEIYQRGLLSKMQEGIRKGEMLQLWVKLAGKICVNPKIRQKLYGSDIHLDVYKQCRLLKGRPELQVMAYFFGSWCYNYERACEWCQRQKLPQFFLQQLKVNNSEEYYRFFHYFSQNNISSTNHLLRIKYFSFMVEQLKQSNLKHHKKHFFKSFKILINDENYKIIIKQKIVNILIQHYQVNNEQSIYQCVHKIVLVLHNFEEFKEIQKQGFWRSLQLFDYKLKDDGVYPHLLKIYIHLLSKYGITKSIDNPYLAIKVIRKGVFSINLQGKRLTLQYIILLSQLQKLYYGRPRCLQILQALLRYQFTQQQINLSLRLLTVKLYPSALQKLQKGTQNQKPILTPKHEKDDVLLAIIDLVYAKYKQTQTSDTQIKTKLLKIINLLCNKEEPALRINSKIKEDLLHTLQIHYTLPVKMLQEYIILFHQILIHQHIQSMYVLDTNTISLCLNSLLKIVQSSKSKYNSNIANKSIECIKLLSVGEPSRDKVNQITKQVQGNPQLKSYPAILEWCQIIQKREKFFNFNENTKNIMREGIKTKMYKIDGSVSELLLFFTENLLQLNCSTAKGAPVKNKWRLSLKDIVKIEAYETNTVQFKNTVFGQSQGLFTKAPAPEVCLSLVSKGNSLFVCFQNRKERKEWQQYIEWGLYNSIKVFDSIK